jgi:hypothetical protein
MEQSNALKNLSSMVEMVDYLVQLHADRDKWKSYFRDFYADVNEQIAFENWDKLKFDVEQYRKLWDGEAGK